MEVCCLQDIHQADIDARMRMMRLYFGCKETDFHRQESIVQAHLDVKCTYRDEILQSGSMEDRDGNVRQITSKTMQDESYSDEHRHDL